MTGNPALDGLLAQLSEAGKRLDAGDPEWRYVVLRGYRDYSKAIGIEVALLHPLQRMVMDEGTHLLGHPGTPLSKALAMSMASAAVSELSAANRVSIADSLAVVAEITGISATELRKFRDNISRGRAPRAARDAYHGYRQEIRAWPDLETLRGLSKLVK